MSRSAALAAWLLVTVLGSAAAAQTPANVLVVYNENADGAAALARTYASGRSVPEAQVIGVRTRAVAEITPAEFERDIQAPLRRWLTANRAQDRILYIVLIHGLPVRLAGTLGRSGTRASIDSELALLYRRLTGVSVPLSGPIPNPYYAGESASGAPPRFSHQDFDIYLVTRLDGFDAADVRGLIERGRQPGATGRFVFDQRPGFDKANEWLEAAAERLSEGGRKDSVVLERTGLTAQGEKDVLGYFSWGSNDPSLRARRPDVSFAPGALAGMFLSSDARTFAEPPAGWAPAGAARGPAMYAGTAQGLLADLVRAGVTGAVGQASEPFLDGTVRPDILFPAYVSGLTLAESFYRAIPSLSWQTVVVGDPLCAPFPGVPVSPAAIDPAIDPATELPSLFSARRVAALREGHVNAEAAAAFARGESRQGRDDLAGAEAAFQEAIAADGSLTAARYSLGTVYEGQQRFDDAARLYQEILDANPKDAIALNNLAYNLAVHQDKPKEALPMAERAQLLSPRSASILDTLGWIRHLVGDTQGALKALVPAARSMPDSADVQLHAAIVLAEAGYTKDAAQALTNAEKADPAIAERPEFKALAQRVR